MYRFFVCCVVAAAASLGHADIVHGEEGRRLDRFLTRTTQFRDGINGSVLVAKDGVVLLDKGYGVADAAAKAPIRSDAVMDIASVTKQFTAALVLRLEMEGKVRLTDPLKKFFPQAPPDKADVTLEQLLNHTSGISSDFDYEKVKKTVDFYKKAPSINFYLKQPMNSKPGEKWAYSNIGYNLVAAALEQATGKTWEGLLREKIFKPAGMNDTWCLGEKSLPESRVPKGSAGNGHQFPYGKKSHWAGYVGAGGVHTTAGDMYKWHRALRSDAILSAEAKTKLFRPNLNNYALGWLIEKLPNGKTRPHHNGTVYGFLSHFMRGLEDDVVVVVLTNTMDPSSVSDLTTTLYAMAETGEDLDPSNPRSISAAELDPWVGTYSTDAGGTIEIVREGTALRLRTDHWPTANAVNQARGMMSGGGSTVGSLVKAPLDGLLAGNLLPLRERLNPRLPAEAADTWATALRESPSLGKLTGYTVLGDYFLGMGLIQQLVELAYERGKARVALTWSTSTLVAMSPASDFLASFTLSPIKADYHFLGSEGSWRGTSLRFSKTESGERVLTLTGMRTLTAKGSG